MSQQDRSYWDPPADEPGSSLAVVPVTATAGALVPASSTIDLAPRAWMVAQKIAGTAFVPDAFRGKAEAVLAAMLTGNELGLPLMQSLAKIHVVNGRPGLAAEVMRSLVLAAGHEIWIEEKSRTSVTVGGKRAGSSREQRVTWTIEDANSAKLSSKEVWKAYPRAMLTARATAELCRDLFPDVIGGLYSVEELEDGFDPTRPEEDVAPAGAIEQAVRTASSPAARKRRSQKAKLLAGGPDPEPPPLPEEEGDDDAVVDAELVEDADDEGAPPLPEEEDGPAQRGQVVKDLQAKVDRAEQAQKMSRAQKIAMRADELGVDRHHVIAAVTGGQKSSGNELDDTEADLVDEALRRLKVGEVRLEEDDDGWCLVDAPAVANGDDDGPGEELAEVVNLPSSLPADAEAWRKHIRDKGRTLSATISRAANIAHELEVVAPTSVNDLPGCDANVQVALLTWLEDDG